MSVTGSIMAGVGLAGSLGGAALSSNAATTAAGDQSQAADQAAQLQYQASQNALNFEKQQYNTSQQEEQPFLESGQAGVGALDYLLGLNPNSTQAAGMTFGSSTPQSVGSMMQGSTANGSPAMPTNRLANSLQNGSIQGPSGSMPASGVSGTTIPTVQPTPQAAGQSGAQAAITNSPRANLDATQGLQSGPGMTSATGTLPSGSTAVPSPILTGAGAVNGDPAREVQGINSANPGAPAPTGTAALPNNGAAAAPGGSAPASGSATTGGFGSLLAPYSGTFTAPTAQQALNSPGEQAQLQLGEQALQQSAAAQGNLLTGGTAQALDAYGQNLASTNYQNVYNDAYNTYATNYNQYQQQQANEYNRLASLAGMGQTTAQTLGTLGSSASNNVSSNLLGTASAMGQDYQNAAAANASGVVGSANAYGGALSSGTNSISNLMLLNQLQGNSTQNDTGLTTGEYDG